MSQRTVVHASLGRELRVYALDTASGALEPTQTLEMPAVVQHACTDAARTRLYVATSDGGPMATVRRPDHFVQMFDLRPDGTLRADGDAVRLANRPVHVSLDVQQRHLLVASIGPSDVSVLRLRPDGRPGEPVPQPPLDFGVAAHQVRPMPRADRVIVPACGHHPTGEAAGSLGIFAYADGRLASHARIDADPGRAGPWRGLKFGAQGFAARHVDFHPTRPWMYLCVERQGEVWLFDCDEDGIAPRPRAIRSTLDGVTPGASMQLAGSIHVHPDGRFLYVSNRARDTARVGDREVFVGGVNDIAVFRIDPASGVPTPIQQADTEGIFPRTFGIDATGRVLVAGNEQARWVDGPTGLRRVSPGLVVFRIGDDGRLTRLSRLDLPDRGDVCFWVDVVTPAAPGEAHGRPGR